jgi:hypothetical protein
VEGITEDQLRDLYTLDHDEFQCVPIAVDQGNGFWISGSITTKEGVHAGSFVRGLVQRSGELVAIHHSMNILEPYRRRHIAFNHYRKAINAYIALDCYRVEMFAYEYGTFVWPQFGFKYTNAEDKAAVADVVERLYAAEAGHRPTQRIASEEYAMILFRSPRGVNIGADAAQRVAAFHPNGALEMYLDLRDGATLDYLRESGILSP